MQQTDETVAGADVAELFVRVDMREVVHDAGEHQRVVFGTREGGRVGFVAIFVVGGSWGFRPRLAGFGEGLLSGVVC